MLRPTARAGVPGPSGLEAVQPRVAGGAEGDQGIVGVPRVAMMDHKPFRAPQTRQRWWSRARIFSRKPPKRARERLRRPSPRPVKEPVLLEGNSSRYRNPYSTGFLGFVVGPLARSAAVWCKSFVLSSLPIRKVLVLNFAGGVSPSRSLTICMCVRFGTKIRGDVFGLVQIYPLCVFGLVLENSLESHKPVENQQFTSSDDPGRRGYLEAQPSAERPLRGR